MYASTFILLALICMLPAILIAPHASVLIWSWFSYMNPHRVTWGFAQNLPLLDVVAGMTFLGWLTSKERKFPHAHPVMYVFVAFFLWTVLTTIFAQNPDMAMTKFIRWAKIALFTFLTMAFITNKERVRTFIYIIIIGLSLYSVKGGIFTIITGGNYHVWGPPRSFMADNNQLALALLVVVPMFYWAYKHTELKIAKLAIGSAGMLTFICAIGSQSRGALVALVAMLGWFIIKSRKWALGTFLSIVVVGGAFTFMPESWVERMESIASYEEDGSASNRLNMWKYHQNVAEAYIPFGGGFSFYPVRSLANKYMPPDGTMQVAHSIYFDALGEHGFIGLFLFLMLFCTSFVTCTEVTRLSKGKPEYAWAADLSQMLQLSLFGFGVGGAFLSLSTFDLLYHLFALCMLMHIALLKEMGYDKLPTKIEFKDKAAANKPDIHGLPAQ